jgi:hypothetical protein
MQERKEQKTRLDPIAAALGGEDGLTGRRIAVEYSSPI